MTARTVYYAHCLAIYDTPQERRDLTTLQELGFTVDNPNRPEVAAAVEELKRPSRQGEYMEYFRGFVLRNDVFAFRALPDGSIPAGVAKELEYARQAEKPIIELPSAVERRTLSLEATRAYLREVGQR